MIKTVEWTKDGVRMLDQRLLPSEETYLMLRSYDEVAEAIKKMVIRGAPAIGVAAAMGIALGASQSVGTSVADLEDDLEYICAEMGKFEGLQAANFRKWRERNQYLCRRVTGITSSQYSYCAYCHLSRARKINAAPLG